MRKLIVTALTAALVLAFAGLASAHTLDRGKAEEHATAFAQAIVDDNEWGIYDFDLRPCRAVTVHRRDCGLTLYYADEDEHAEGACDVTLTVRYASTRSHRLRVYDRGDWDCDADA